jgi:hypothetical protein
MTVCADLSGVVVYLRPVAAKTQRAGIGPGSLGAFGMAIRALRLVNVRVVCTGSGRGMTDRARGVRGMMRFVALCAIGLGPLASFGVTRVTKQAVVFGVREWEIA